MQDGETDCDLVTQRWIFAIMRDYDAQTVIPGEAITMLMEFQAIDAILPAGHGIRFVLSDQGEDYLAPACGNTYTDMLFQ